MELDADTPYVLYNSMNNDSKVSVYLVPLEGVMKKVFHDGRTFFSFDLFHGAHAQIKGVPLSTDEIFEIRDYADEKKLSVTRLTEQGVRIVAVLEIDETDHS